MAGADYICCSRCDTKIIYDGDFNGRERIGSVWDYKAKILCPECILLYETQAKTALECIRAGKYSTAIKSLCLIDKKN